ncbi:Peptidyl-prolyl cis-trans isomerase [Granulibacter bethesdensis CGDNIH1]|uniref:Parvulin-like PPIase n=2 Tax=Granulibacter bethesdensis TaxID=364410 RepID=Q0BUI1_GRABC|nr:Peptidyl-prolyl cis-trans isomerase [Granulibacter bethesdensis CGDNIH1]APH51319.1 Peptidyl-prolyl cis-trans isomerase [Granulibacter bethesdensis]APH64013.1 Peptidyl-prolyl cis-trans isomerase [Granulibacter bethesdensis]
MSEAAAFVMIQPQACGVYGREAISSPPVKNQGTSMTFYPTVSRCFSSTRSRTLMAAALLAGSAGLSVTAAQADDAASAQKAAPPPSTVVGRVNGADIHLGDLEDAARNLPEQMRQAPPQVIYPILLNQMLQREALVQAARKEGLDKKPDVAADMKRAANQTLQNDYIREHVGPLLTDEALRKKFDKELAGKPGEEEVHARHILVPTEDEAKRIIAELKAGGDFAKIAKERSKDPGAANGGDLGFFKQADMVPEFSKAAFALKNNEVSPTPVHTQFGWHVIQTLEHRRAPAQTFEQARDQLRQQVIQDGVKDLVTNAMKGAKVERFNPDGSVPKPEAAPAAPAPAKN